MLIIIKKVRSQGDSSNKQSYTRAFHAPIVLSDEVHLNKALKKTHTSTVLIVAITAADPCFRKHKANRTKKEGKKR